MVRGQVVLLAGVGVQVVKLHRRQSAFGDLRFTRLFAYGRATCGLTADGSAYCWGYNGWGMLARPTGTSQSATPVLISSTLRFRTLSAGAEHICGIAMDDRAYCWGANGDGQFGTGSKRSPSSRR